MDKLDIKERLALLFTWWYGYNICVINKLLKNQPPTEKFLVNLKKDLKSTHILDIWVGKWFAKKKLTKKVDKFLTTEFKILFDEILPDENIGENFWIDMALLILYDQVSRNIFRGTKKAYKTDSKALKISRFWIKKHEDLGFHYICTLCISLSHSENIEDQNIVYNYLKTNLFKSHYNKHQTIYNTLCKIHNNHRNRIIYFNRIPERNIILNRHSTEKELIYMNNI